MGNHPPTYRVIYVGRPRQMTSRREWPVMRWDHEDETAWGQRLAGDMEKACQEMARRGLRLFSVVPVQTSSPPVSLSGRGSWNEGVWLYFVNEG